MDLTPGLSGVNYTRRSTPADSRLSDLILDVLATSLSLGIQRVSSLSLAINTTSFTWADSRDSVRFFPHITGAAWALRQTLRYSMLPNTMRQASMGREIQYSHSVITI